MPTRNTLRRLSSPKSDTPPQWLLQSDSTQMGPESPQKGLEIGVLGEFQVT